MQRANFFHRLLGLLAAALLAVCCLPMTALAADSSTVTFNIEYLDEGRVVGTQEGVTAETDKDDLVDMTKLDYKLPAGFEMGINSDKFFVENRETVSVHLKRIRVNFTLDYLDETGHVVSTQTGLNAPVDKDLLVDMTKLPYELPAGFEMANNSDKFFIEDGDTIAVHIKHIYVNFSLQYRDEDNRILGTQKNISAPIDAEGKVDLASLSLTLPEGCTLAQAPGKLAVKNGDTAVLGVKAPPVPQTVTVNYWDVENKTAAGTGRITVDKGTALEIPVHMLPADPAPRTGDKPASAPASTAKPAATAQPAAKPAASGKDAKDTKAAPAARNEVVKANAPAANTSKIIPQTGLSLKSPVLLGVMMVAALAAAGLYLFVIRKKLN